MVCANSGPWGGMADKSVVGTSGDKSSSHKGHRVFKGCKHFGAAYIHMRRLLHVERMWVKFAQKVTLAIIIKFGILPRG